jgi:hypothetical protein
VLLAGDAVVHSSWLAAEDVERVAHDADRAATVRNQVRAVPRPFTRDRTDRARGRGPASPGMVHGFV